MTVMPPKPTLPPSKEHPYPQGQLSDGKKRTILFDSTSCIGCRQCVQACKDWNELPRGSLYEFSKSTWITIEPPVYEGTSSIWSRNSCMHCEYPMCAAVCPVEAIIKYDEGPVVIDQSKCIGCEYCVYACPWDVISIDDVRGKATKCTMCYDRIAVNQEPFCVKACPVQALYFGHEDEMKANAAKRAKEKDGYNYGVSEAGGANVLYVLTRKPEDYGIRSVTDTKFPKHRIPKGIMLKGLLTKGGVTGKARAILSALLHSRRLRFRYWQ